MRNVFLPSIPVANFELLEVPVAAATVSQVAIPDQPMLKSYQDKRVVLKCIQLYTDKVLTKAPLSGNATAPLSELIKSSLVLYVNGWERLHIIPLLSLNAVSDADATTATTIPFVSAPMNFEGISDVDWTKSYIKYSNGQTSVGTAYSFLFGINYVVLDGAGNMVKPK